MPQCSHASAPVWRPQDNFWETHFTFHRVEKESLYLFCDEIFTVRSCLAQASQRSTCLSLLSAGTAGVCHHAKLEGLSSFSCTVYARLAGLAS